MRDIIGDVVRELEASKVLKGGWSRDCPIDRQERALIEPWVAMTTKFRDKYTADVGRLESIVTEQAQKLSKANGTIASQSEQLREVVQDKVRVGINAHVDRLGPKIGSDEVTRLKSDVAAA